MKVIPIIGGAPTTSACSEESGTVPRLDLPLTRREFLQGSGVLTGTLAAGSVLVTLAPSRSWAVELKTLSSAEGETLMKMGRVLYPHPKLPDAVYALLAKDLDADAGKSAAMQGQPFFNAVRGKCITSLYDNDIAFVTFGYPGASWDKGGYITRGFQDLKWLPNPPAAASPPSGR